MHRMETIAPASGSPEESAIRPFTVAASAAAIPVATIASDTDVFLKFIEESFGGYGIMTDKSIEKFNRLPN